MKKRIISGLLAAAYIMTGLTACGNRYYEDSQRHVTSTSTEIVKNDTDSIYYPTETSEWSYYEKAEGFNSVLEVEGCVDDSFVPFNTEEYNRISENGFRRVSLSPLSTFSADVDTASYSNLRRMINNGYSIDDVPKGAVRTEELINYFNYNYELPKKGMPFGVTTELGDCPWNKTSKLLSIGIKTEKIDFADAPSSNIVFLIDVSGSMDSEDRLPLLVKSFKLLVEELGEKDKVSIVTYAGFDSIVLDGVCATEKETIKEALDGLMAYGGTNGGKGIQSAYKLANKNFIEGGNNRVILATDGDLNIGITNQSDLDELIRKESKSGVFLSVLGFGSCNYSDANLETLADAGNGNYAYIDSLMEAKKVLCEQLGATFVTVAKDVKFQVEFNPAVVAEYRLIGYEDRLLAAEDFNDDTKDAGEIGAGHCVTALYEIVTVDGTEGKADKMKYQESVLTKDGANLDEWLTVNIRYKEPDKDSSKLISVPVGKADYRVNNSQDFLWAALVAEFAQIVRQEEYVDNVNLDDVVKRISKLEIDDEYKSGFKQMVANLISNQTCIAY